MSVNYFYSKNKTNVGNKGECIISLALYMFYNFNNKNFKNNENTHIHYILNILEAYQNRAPSASKAFKISSRCFSGVLL